MRGPLLRRLFFFVIQIENLRITDNATKQEYYITEKTCASQIYSVSFIFVYAYIRCS